jgi:hypothetical protein
MQSKARAQRSTLNNVTNDAHLGTSFFSLRLPGMQLRLFGVWLLLAKVLRQINFLVIFS